MRHLRLILLRRSRTVLFCVCKVSLQSLDIMPPKSLLSVIIIIIIKVVWQQTGSGTCTLR